MRADFFLNLDEAFGSVNTPEDAFRIACEQARQVGFEHVIHAPVRNHPDASKNWAATSYPLAWQEIYQAKGYLSRNPVRQRTEISSVPFQWSTLEKTLPKQDRELFLDCRDCGMRDGYVVPVHGPWGQAVAIGFACQSLEAINNPGKTILQLLAHKLYHLFMPLQTQKPLSLTARERQILLLLAHGRQNPDIADKLSISDHAVEWHLKNIYRKLEVNNRTAAVIKSIQLGLLEL